MTIIPSQWTYDDFVNDVIVTSEQKVTANSLEAALIACGDRLKDPDAIVMEFGVYSGRTLTVIARHADPTIVHGFDSFEGLPETWRAGYFEKGVFNRDGVPPAGLPHNSKLHIGWFDDWLPPFKRDVIGDRNVTFIHVDCDLYSSTKTILDTIGSNIHDTVLEFDELLEYDGFRDHELKALWEFLEPVSDTMSYEIIGRSGECVSMRLKRIPPPESVPPEESVPPPESVPPEVSVAREDSASVLDSHSLDA